jgi:hypothetical protein
LKINAKGLENGLRGQDDGICFLGNGDKKNVNIILEIGKIP